MPVETTTRCSICGKYKTYVCLSAFKEIPHDKWCKCVGKVVKCKHCEGKGVILESPDSLTFPKMIRR